MLTRKQLQLLEFIRDYMAREGIAPSFDEMKDALGLRSKSGVHRLVSALEERGFLRRLPHRARGLEIIRQPGSPPPAAEAPGFTPRVVPGGMPERAAPQRPAGAREVEAAALEVPLMGRIAAGTPIEAIAHVHDQVAVPGQMIASGARHYALEVQGDSMIEAGINDGDIVIIREQEVAENGDIVVALVDGEEATLKKWYRRGAMIALEPANPAYETRILPEERVRVQGRLVGLIRSY